MKVPSESMNYSRRRYDNNHSKKLDLPKKNREDDNRNYLKKKSVKKND